MTSQHPYDVAIVGYGPTGVTAANLLGAMGLRVVVLERDESLFSRARAISTDEEVMRIWQQIGLADRLKQDVLADRPLDFVDMNGRSFVSAHPTPHGYGHPPQMFIYQPAVEQVLRDGVLQYPNVEVRLGQECLRVQQDDDGVELTCLQVGTDAVTRVHASYVIAADGGSSPIRTQLNVGYEGRTYEDRWVVIDTQMIEEWPGHDRLKFHCDPARPAVDCPTPLGHHRWEFPILPGEDEDHLVSDDAIWTLLARYGITEANVKILRATVYSHHVRFAARWRVGRVFLAGDAAHAMPPWIGQGMSAGVRDAANLCWKIASVVRGELSDDVLDSYEAERQPHVRDVTRRAVFAGRFITERRRILAMMRNPALRAIGRIGPLNAWLQRSLWIPAAQYPAGFLSESRPAVGRRLPQPDVLDAHGQRAKLDDVLGTGWVVMCLSGASVPSAWRRTGARALHIGSDVIDFNGVLISWMRAHNADIVALRPDGFIYAAAGAGHTLAPPPASLTITSYIRSNA